MCSGMQCFVLCSFYGDIHACEKFIRRLGSRAIATWEIDDISRGFAMVGEG
jgi:hypothetical protein